MYESSTTEGILEILSIYTESGKRTPDVSELPIKCKNCSSTEYYIDSYTDDIDIVCGVCNHTAGYLPGYGYDPITGKKLNKLET